MIVGIADTHTIVWYLMNDNRLSASAKEFLELSAQEGNQVGISSITLVEIPLDLQITRTLSRISPGQIPDMPDRIIAATALHLNVPIVSRDRKILLSNIQTIW